jgi:hypothetical protein
MKKQTGFETDEGSEMTPTKSFIESTAHSLNGLELEPYTIERMWAADAIGLRYGRLTKAQAKQLSEDNTYPGMEADTVIVVWLCSLKDVEEVNGARRNPVQANQAAIKWAIEHKMASKLQKNFREAYRVFNTIMDEVFAAYGEPEGTEKKTERKATTK